MHEGQDGGEDLIFAYADPPYPRMAYKYGAEEVDHRELIRILETSFPDGWALSTSEKGLKIVLPLCAEDVRIGSWVKPFCSFKPGISPAYAWEPVLFRPGRKNDRKKRTVRNWCAVNIAIKKGLFGAKPEGFYLWLFDLLGMEVEDEIYDLYPGTHGLSKALKKWKRKKTQPALERWF